MIEKEVQGVHEVHYRGVDPRDIIILANMNGGMLPYSLFVGNDKEQIGEKGDKLPRARTRERADLLKKWRGYSATVGLYTTTEEHSSAYGRRERRCRRR